MNFTALKFEPHTILKAYAVLYGELPGGTTLFLDRKSLRRQWEARAKGLNQAQGSGVWGHAGQREDTLDFEELDWAYRSLLDLLGGQDQALVSGWACENIEAVNAVLHKGRNLMTTRRATPANRTRPAPAGVSASSTRPASRATPPVARSSRSAAAPSMQASGAQVQRAHPQSPVAPPTAMTEPFEAPAAANVPPPRLRPMFGRFLLARGHITLQQLIDAVRWQRAQRPPVGRIAMNWGILSANQVYEILSEKAPQDRFCDVAVRKGYMTGYQRLAVLGRQREMQKPIGTYFVEHGILSRDEVEGLAAEAKCQ